MICRGVASFTATSKPQHILVEAAVESLEAALAAAEGGAHRIELCTDLANGGTTPDLKVLRACRSQLLIPIFVLVRPRAGDFVYSAAEHNEMLEQIVQAKKAGARGIVTGALTAQQDIDQVRTSELINAAGKKINPREIEHIILQIDGVRQVKVYGEPAGARGEVVAAAVVATPEVTREQVRAFCRERLSLHKVPRIVKLIERIPIDERGKVKRAALISAQ